ncbi:hypothetical protein [uncultured Roseobacter sp.]|uniref:hypothetical protein n=1 Tax=uncultured Roseobacter sp. TaxID=114847 RepID=UPI00260E5F9E|nr:hypothetical protein [uncultured Roseobacter sp.]
MFKRYLGPGLALLLVSATHVAAQSVYQGYCRGSFDGVPLEGVFKVDYYPRSDTYNHHAVFRDQAGNRYDIEVISNQNGGVGGAWQNGARHREMKIEMRYSGNSLFIRELYGASGGQFTCN